MWVPRGLKIRWPRARVPRIRPSQRIIRPLWGTIRHVISPFSTLIHCLLFYHPLTQYRHLQQVYLNGSVNLNFYPLHLTFSFIFYLFFFLFFLFISCTLKQVSITPRTTPFKRMDQKVLWLKSLQQRVMIYTCGQICLVSPKTKCSTLARPELGINHVCQTI